MRYKWDKVRGVVDDDGKQILQLISNHCSTKFKNMAGKELVNKLNTIELGKELAAMNKE